MLPTSLFLMILLDCVFRDVNRHHRCRRIKGSQQETENWLSTFNRKIKEQKGKDGEQKERRIWYLAVDSRRSMCVLYKISRISA